MKQLDKGFIKEYKWPIITVLSILALFILPLEALFFPMVFLFFPMFLIGLLALTNEGDWSWTKTEKWPWQRRIFYLASFWIVAGFVILTDDYTPSSSSSSSYSSSSSSSSSSGVEACIKKSERQFESCIYSIPGNASESDMNYCLDLHEARSYGCRTGRRK